MNQFVKLALFILLFNQSVFATQSIDSQSGLVIDKGYKAVKQQCSTCHSLIMVIQNKASREGWLDTIRWMQNTQGMPLLNQSNENIILNYLAKNYPSNKKGRRSAVIVKKWKKY